MQSSAAIEITIRVPVQCEVVSGKPKCNLDLVQVDPRTWTDKDGTYIITIIDDILTVEAL